MQSSDPRESIQIFSRYKVKIRLFPLENLFRKPLRIIGLQNSGGIDHLIIRMVLAESVDGFIQDSVIISVFNPPVAAGENADHDFLLSVKSPFSVDPAENNERNQDKQTCDDQTPDSLSGKIVFFQIHCRCP